MLMDASSGRFHDFHTVAGLATEHWKIKISKRREKEKTIRNLSAVVRPKYWQVTGSPAGVARDRLIFVHGRIRWEKKTW